MGKHHTEETVIPILLRKGLTVKEYDYDEQGVKSLVKQIGIPTEMQLGIRILGKLDFMRIKGWKVINKNDMKVVEKVQRKKSDKKEQSDKMKDSFKKKKFFAKKKIK